MEIENQVKNQIGIVVGYPGASILNDWQLKNPPLNYASQDFTFLAKRLRKIVKEQNPEQTILKKEISGSSLNVEKIIKLVKERINVQG